LSPVDAPLLAEKAAAFERHLARVAEKLPPSPEQLLPMSDAADAVILHLWQATQIAIDLALAAWTILRCRVSNWNCTASSMGRDRERGFSCMASGQNVDVLDSDTQRAVETLIAPLR